MSSAIERVRAVIAPLVDARGLGLYDLELGGGTLRVVVERADGGVDIDAIAELTRAVSHALDEADPISGRYTLEVSSPGLERNLRTAAHFAGAVGSEVKVKLRAAAADDDARRLQGVLTAADERSITVRDEAGDEHRYEHDQIERARTVFAWGPGPKPKASKKSPGKGKKVTTAS